MVAFDPVSTAVRVAENHLRAVVFWQERRRSEYFGAIKASADRIFASLSKEAKQCGDRRANTRLDAMRQMFAALEDTASSVQATFEALGIERPASVSNESVPQAPRYRKKKLLLHH